MVPRDADGRGAMRRARAHAIRVSARGAEPPRLLLVESKADTAESLHLLLEMLGYAVDTALDAATAAALARRHAFALGFVAINLPDEDGYALARRLRAAGSPRVLVAMTGHGSVKDVERVTAAVFDAHLLEPATVEQLENVLNRFLANDPE
jgi:CheY-like chemotaxis protein